jgi:hypothetical protein
VGGDGGEQGTCWSNLGFVLPKIFKIKIFESWWFDMVDTWYDIIKGNSFNQ